MISGWGLHEQLESARRILSQADADKREKLLIEIARECVSGYLRSGMAKPDIIDGLREVGLDSGLSETQVQDCLAVACSDLSTSPEANERQAPPAFVLDASNRLVVRRASDIAPQPVRWLWPGRLPLGKVTLLAGEPGLGKSQLTCEIAASVSTGREWPLGEGRAPLGNVLIFSAEDDAADTIRPRLEAAGADLNRVSIVTSVNVRRGNARRSFSLQDDLPLLEAEIERIGDLVLVIIDPVTSYLGKVDSHKNAELRAVLEPLGELAARRGFSVLAVTHFSKGGTGSANNRIIGSIAFVAAARAAHIVALDKDDEERRLFIPTKNNVGPKCQGLSFRMQLLKISNGEFAPSVLWEGATDISAEEALGIGSGRDRSAPAREEAEEFLKAILANAPLPQRRIKSEAEQAGVAWAAVRRAKTTLGVTASKSGLDGGWVWELPSTA